MTLGCSEKKTVIDGDIIVVNVIKKNYTHKELYLQDFMDVEYIPLETKELFYNQGFVQDIGKKLIILSNRNNDGIIYIYDRTTGKAISNINRKGQGGEEYTIITNVILNEEDSEIFVHDHFLQKMIVYDLYGNFKRAFKYKQNRDDFFYTAIFNYDKNNLICYDQYSKTKTFVLISKQDGSINKEIEVFFKEKKFLRAVFKDKASGRELMVGAGYFSSIIPFQNNWILSTLSSDTVYTFSKDYGLSPFIVRTPAIESMEPEVFLILRFFSDRYYFMETIKNIYDFDTESGFPKTFFMYDKLEKKFYGYKVFNNDFSIKKEIYMSALRPVYCENISWQSLEAHHLVEHYKKGELKGKLKEIAASLDDDSNPVIMLIKLKK